MNSPYLAFVVAAYLVAALGLGGIVLWVLLDRRAARAALARAERAAERHKAGADAP
ncbi:MAG: hypothetical protein AcusKO_25060 [Acuticoccus sp.]